MKNSNSYADLTVTILQSLSRLLPHHPASFRPFVSQIQSLIAPLLAPTPSSILSQEPLEEYRSYSFENESEAARHLFVLLSMCASKTISGQEWTQSFSGICEKAHQTADLAFRALNEDWAPLTRTTSRNGSGPGVFTDQIGLRQDPSTGLPSWKGIYAGLERLNGELLTLQAFLASPNLSAVAVPLGEIVNLARRMLLALPPPVNSREIMGNGTRTFPEASREEREALWSWLPRIHISSLGLLWSIVSRLQEGSVALLPELLDQVLWVFQNEESHPGVREVSYRVLAAMLPLGGAGPRRTIASPLAHCLGVCCDDCLGSTAEKSTTPLENESGKPTATMIMVDSNNHSKSVGKDPSPQYAETGLQQSSAILLCSALSSLPSDYLPFPVRAKINRTAVLSQNSSIMQASIVHPLTQDKNGQQGSIISFFARAHADSVEAEALLRPRMPVILIYGQGDSLGPDEEVSGAAQVDTMQQPEAWGASTAFHYFNDPEKIQATSEFGKTDAEHVEAEEHLQASPKETRLEDQWSQLPTKRSIEESNTGGLSQPDDPEPDAANKRARVENAGLHAASTNTTTKLDDLSIIATSETNKSEQSSAELQPSSDLSAKSNLITQTDQDGDSDDSSIPAIDPTLDTDEEFAEDEEAAEEEEIGSEPEE